MEESDRINEALNSGFDSEKFVEFLKANLLDLKTELIPCSEDRAWRWTGRDPRWEAQEKEDSIAL